MENMIIGFSKSKGFKPFSWAIRLFEGTNYSHVYIKFENTYYGDTEIYQASKGMVNHLLEPQFLVENEVLAEFLLSFEEKKNIIKFLRERLGRPYSVSTVIGIFLSKVGIISRKFYDNEHAYICSELVARVLKEMNKLPNTIEVDKATPEQLYNLCLHNFTQIK